MRSRLWLYSGISGWHFITLPKKQSKEIKKMFSVMAAGWGSLPVIANIGKTSWKTSIFPDNKISAYLLPIKLEIRKKEKIVKGDMVDFSIEIKV